MRKLTYNLTSKYTFYNQSKNYSRKPGQFTLELFNIFLKASVLYSNIQFNRLRINLVVREHLLVRTKMFFGGL